MPAVTHVVTALLAAVTAAAAVYTDQFAVCVDGHGEEYARRLAQKHGFELLHQIVGDCFLLKHHEIRKRSLSSSPVHHSLLKNEDKVTFVEQQKVKRRVKRDHVQPKPARHRRRTRDGKHQRAPVYRSTFLSDPSWPRMWYLNRGGGLDMNVQGAWSQGVTGRGVVVTILDDGLEKDHPDLMDNYDPMASYDVNSHDSDPQPRYDLNDSNRHGTRCAGEVAGVANNSLCAVGVAFGANIGGVRMLDGEVTDAVEALSLSLNQQHIDIYSASWGPDDDGETVDGPGELAKRAFREGILNGRAGKGSIFVWASGNGGRELDNCNCDGYTNSLWTLSISSATERGNVPWYSEACSSTLATTYSSGSSIEKQIVTTDLHRGCTATHTGTSASAPLAAGICALALEVNQQLTWRDMQHIVVRTARRANLQAPDWVTNGVGRNVSHSFGYGLMDATAMVELARRWTPVPDQRKCETPSEHVDKLVPSHSKVVLTLSVSACAGVNYMEHVQARISLDASRRGDIKIFLTSPAGTTSTLLDKRPHDSSRAGFKEWPFMTTHNWDESPLGTWSLEVHNDGRYTGEVVLAHWTLVVFGVPYNPNDARSAATPPPPPPPPPVPPPRSGVHVRHSEQKQQQGRTAFRPALSGSGRWPKVRPAPPAGRRRGHQPATVSDWTLVMFGNEVEAGTAPPARPPPPTPPPPPTTQRSVAAPTTSLPPRLADCLRANGSGSHFLVLTQEQWVEQQRKDRPAEFAPPAQYEPRRPARGRSRPSAAGRMAQAGGTSRPTAPQGTERPPADRTGSQPQQCPPEGRQHQASAAQLSTDAGQTPAATTPMPSVSQLPPNRGQPPPNMGQPPPNMGQPPVNTGQPPPNMGQPPPYLGQSPLSMGRVEQPRSDVERLPPHMEQPPPTTDWRPASSGPLSGRPARVASYRARRAAAADLPDPDGGTPAETEGSGRGAGVEVEPPATAEYFGGTRRGRRQMAARPDVGSAIEAGLALLSEDTEQKYSKTFDL